MTDSVIYYSMRGRIEPNPSFIAVVDLDARVRSNHPLRRIKEVCDKALKDLDSDFDRVYKDGGRPSIPPECRRTPKVIRVRTHVECPK